MKNPYADFVLEVFPIGIAETPEARIRFAAATMTTMAPKDKRSRKVLFDAFAAHVPADALRAAMEVQ